MQLEFDSAQSLYAKHQLVRVFSLLQPKENKYPTPPPQKKTMFREGTRIWVMDRVC